VSGSVGSVMVIVSVFVFVAIAVGFGLHKIIGWYLDGVMSGTQSMLTGAFYITTIALIIAFRLPIIRIVLSVLLLAVFLLLSSVTKRIDRRSSHLLDDEKMEQYRKAISADPGNLAARSRLAEALYNQGRLDEAIEELRETVKRSPSSTSDVQRLRYFEREKDERRDPTIACPSCGHKNPHGHTVCTKCGSELSISKEIRKWLMNKGLRQIAISSGITMGICTIVLVALDMVVLPLRIGIIALLLLVALITGYLHIQRNC